MQDLISYVLPLTILHFYSYKNSVAASCHSETNRRVMSNNDKLNEAVNFDADRRRSPCRGFKPAHEAGVLLIMSDEALYDVRRCHRA